MRIVIAGTGSIGKRHIRNVCALSTHDQVEWVFVREHARQDSLSAELGVQVVSSWAEATVSAPDLAIIASPTSHHIDALEQLIPAQIPFYVEKPVVAEPAQLLCVTSLLKECAFRAPTLVGCNLRYLPSLLQLKRLLSEGVVGNVVRASFQAGQWLPDWRPQHAYQRSYSASRDLGGGAVLDLIHEFDIARWLLGELKCRAAVGGCFSDLEIHTEDVATALLVPESGPAYPVTVCVDYVSRKPVRRYEIVGDQGTLVWDLAERRLTLLAAEGARVLNAEEKNFSVGDTYVSAMSELLTAIRSDTPAATTQPIEDGLRSAELAFSVREMADL